MRCPRCGGLETKRHGTTGSAPRGLDGPGKRLQRFFCHTCSRTFTLSRRTARPGARFDDNVAMEAARLYVQGLSSYRTLARIMKHRLGEPVGRVALNSWVDRLGGMALTPLEMSARLGLRWGGYLGVDARAIFIKGEEH